VNSFGDVREVSQAANQNLQELRSEA